MVTHLVDRDNIVVHVSWNLPFFLETLHHSAQVTVGCLILKFHQTKFVADQDHHTLHLLFFVEQHSSCIFHLLSWLEYFCRVWKCALEAVAFFYQDCSKIFFCTVDSFGSINPVLVVLCHWNMSSSWISSSEKHQSII